MNHYLLLFDIDGTLLSTGGCGKFAFERAFEKMFGISRSWGNTFPDGKTDMLIFNEITVRCIGRKLTENEWVELSERYAAYFAEESEHDIKFRTTPGAFKLLEYLSDLPHVHLAVATGNIEKVSWMKLRKVRLHNYFRCGGFGARHTNRVGILNDALNAAENHFDRKFSKRKTFVIGDTRHDVVAAHQLKLRSIGVDTGSTRGQDFLEVRPHHRLADFTDLDAFVRLLGKSTESY